MNRLVTLHLVNVTGLCEIRYQLVKTEVSVMDEKVSQFNFYYPHHGYAGCADKSFLSANYMKDKQCDNSV